LTEVVEFSGLYTRIVIEFEKVVAAPPMEQKL
jgi:hypothetical protein